MIAQFKKNSYQWSPLVLILIVLLACISLPDARHTMASETSAAKPPAIVVRQVWAEAVNPFYIGTPSPDGKCLAYSDWDELIDGVMDRIMDRGFRHDMVSMIQAPVFSEVQGCVCFYDEDTAPDDTGMVHVALCDMFGV